MFAVPGVRDPPVIGHQVRPQVMLGHQQEDKEMNEITNQEDQVSWLKINKGKKVIINANGLVNDDNTALISYGYWYWNSADEWLPLTIQ